MGVRGWVCCRVQVGDGCVNQQVQNDAWVQEDGGEQVAGVERVEDACEGGAEKVKDDPVQYYDWVEVCACGLSGHFGGRICCTRSAWGFFDVYVCDLHEALPIPQHKS